MTSYSVRANPVLHEFGEFEGQLASVRFTADSGAGAHKEWQVPVEHLDTRLRILESSVIRHNVLSKLRAGGRVELPGKYKVAQLEAMGFGAAS